MYELKYVIMIAAFAAVAGFSLAMAIFTKGKG
jgi:hypothetical protein